MATSEAETLRKAYSKEIGNLNAEIQARLQALREAEGDSSSSAATIERLKKQVDYTTKQRDNVVAQAKKDGIIYEAAHKTVKIDKTVWPDTKTTTSSSTTASAKTAASSTTTASGHSEKFNNSEYVQSRAQTSAQLQSEAVKNANALLESFNAKQQTEYNAAVALYVQEHGSNPTSTSQLKTYGYDADAWAQKKQDGCNSILSSNPDLSLTSSGFVASTTTLRTSSKVKNTFSAPSSEASKRLKKLKEQQEKEEKKKKKQEAIDKAVADDKDAYKKYKEALEENKKEQKKKLEEQAEARKKQIDKNKEDLEKNAEEDAKETSKSLDKFISTHPNTGTYTGTAQEAKNNLKELGKIIISGGEKEIGNSSSSTEYGTIGFAKNLINQLKNPLDFSNNSVLKDENTKNLLKTLVQGNKDTQLSLATLKLTQKMSAQVVIDTMAEQIRNQKQLWKSMGKTMSDTILLQKAYINSYIKNTFGNPEFMKKVSTAVSAQVTNYVDATIDEKMVSVNKKINNTFTKVTDKVNSTTNKVNSKLDTLSKINIVKSINDKLDSCLSLSSFEAKMNKNPLTKALAGPLMLCAKSTTNVVTNLISSSTFVKTLKAAQSKIVNLQKAISAAKEKALEKVQQLKNYVTKLKNQAIAAVKSYASKIVSDIVSKISVSAGKIKL